MTRKELKAVSVRKQELKVFEATAMASMLIGGISNRQMYIDGLLEIEAITEEEAELIEYKVAEKYELEYANKTCKEVRRTRISEL